MKQLGFFVAASFIFHFLVSSTTIYWAEKMNSSRPADVTELEVIDNNPVNDQLEKTRQMIRQLKTTVEKIKEIKQRARFESEETQRVSKETQAAKLGLTQNSLQQALARQNQLTQNSQKQETTPEVKKQEDGELPEFARPKKYQPSGISQVTPPSTLSTQLPNDISLSNATNLNTDSGTYYSFYSRVEELFYVRWVERNNYHWGRISLDYKRSVLSGRVWTTELEVWLDAEGRYNSSYIRKSSGYQPFDEATVYAFKNAGFFPNPPKAKVEADGYVRLRYRFNVHVTQY